ncbi:MAG: hypothetical protein KAH20_13775 [Methylococcales bacterium]|nr:hypothetical protein [Methylococcales bacterium]
MNKKIKLKNIFLITIVTFMISCDYTEDQESPNNNDFVIYASEAPYNLTASLNCSENRANIQAVIDKASASNKKLIIGKGTYCIDGTLFIPSNLEIDFSNATIERVTGDKTIIFDLITNNDPVNGNTGITLRNLIINGNSIADGLENKYGQQRFSGLKLDNCSDIKLDHITVKETVNAEYYAAQSPAAGIFVLHSKNITCTQIDGFDNFGTAIIFWDSDKVSVDGSITHNNKGSGLGAAFTHNSQFMNLTSYDNFNPKVNLNYSNITINGLNNKVLNVDTWGSDATGLNLGHSPNSTSPEGNPSDYAVIDNVVSHDNALEGITITYSKHISVTNIKLYNNKRHNLMIHDGSSHVIINNAEIYSDPEFAGGINPFGIYIYSGGEHTIDNAKIYNNYHGIYIQDITSPVSIGSEVYIYNNGSSASSSSSGIKIVGSQNILLNNPKIYCDQPDGSKRQNYGVFVANSDHLFIRAKIWGNSTKQYHIQNSGSDVVDTIIY